MFGFNSFFAALKRLTASVETMASLFDAANDRLRERFCLDEPADATTDAVPAIEHKNGRKKTAV